MIKANYHTHTTFCDGKDTAEDIVKYAVSLGMTHLGFSGHMDPEIHMDFPLYSAEIGRMKRFGKENRAGLLVSRVTQDTARTTLASDTGLSPSVMQLSRCFSSQSWFHAAVLLPRACIATCTVWALPRSLATTGGITVVFSSWRY